MIKVRFLKDHVRWKIGDIAVLDNTQAAYLEKMKVAEMQGIERPEDTEKILFQHLEPEKKSPLIKTKVGHAIVSKEFVSDDELESLKKAATKIAKTAKKKA